MARIFLQSVDTTVDRDKKAIQGLVAILTFEEKFDQCFGKLLTEELANNGKRQVEIIFLLVDLILGFFF